MACHAIGGGARNKVGPELNGLDGRHSGTAEGYSYSDANKNSGITWSEAEFKDYIKDPKAKIPGTKMIFPGIKNEKEASDLWAFLAQYDNDRKTKERRLDPPHPDSPLPRREGVPSARPSRRASGFPIRRRRRLE